MSKAEEWAEYQRGMPKRKRPQFIPKIGFGTPGTPDIMVNDAGDLLVCTEENSETIAKEDVPELIKWLQETFLD